jgi:hypothetical protein
MQSVLCILNLVLSKCLFIQRVHSCIAITVLTARLCVHDVHGTDIRFKTETEHSEICANYHLRVALSLLRCLLSLFRAILSLFGACCLISEVCCLFCTCALSF